MAVDGITYLEWLQVEYADALTGTWRCLGPPVVDYPTMWEQIWPPAMAARPNAEAERELQNAIDEVREARKEAEHQAEAEAGI